MSYNLVQSNDPILREKAKHIETTDQRIMYIADRMMNILNGSKSGVGLAAPQIGVSLRMIALNTPSGLYGVFINPEIFTAHRNGENLAADYDDEQCLSLPGITVRVLRYSFIEVQMMRLTEKAPEFFSLSGVDARIVQHEIDHLNGILISDKR